MESGFIFTYGPGSLTVEWVAVSKPFFQKESLGKETPSLQQALLTRVRLPPRALFCPFSFRKRESVSCGKRKYIYSKNSTEKKKLLFKKVLRKKSADKIIKEARFLKEVRKNAS